jgi:hypothetical protein
MERKLAIQFVQQEAKGYPVMIVPPEILYTFNMKAPPEGTYENVDSALFFSSDYIKDISDSVFLHTYFKSFIEQSKETGLDLYFSPDIESFLEVKRPAYIVRFAQMELVEDTTSFQVEERIDFVTSQKKISYTSIGLSTWFEISMKDSLRGYTYFDEQFVTDEVFGDFVQNLWSFDVRYEYNIVKMDLEDVYLFASYMGESHAKYLFDLMLNSYIWYQIPNERKKKYVYLHYNPKYKIIEAADEAFIMMDED